jgi:mutator protein MutT
MPISDHLRELRALVGTRLLQVPSVAAIIRDERGRILFQRRASDGRWSLPSGAIDPGETPEEAIVREVREETGLSVIPTKLLAVYSGERFRHVYEGGDRVEYMVAVFRCDVVGGALGGEEGETLELRYFDHDERPELVLPYPQELFDDRAGFTL